MRKRNSQPDPRTFARDPESVRARVGMVGPSTGGSTLEGAIAPYPLSHTRTGNGVDARAAAAFAGHGRIHALNRVAAGKCDWTHLGPGRSGRQARMGASRPSQGQESDWCTAQRYGDRDFASASRETSGAGFSLTKAGRCSKSARWLGTRRTSVRGSKTSGGTICGIPGRHGTCSRVRPLFALQEMAGWETEKMVRRYAHLPVGHLAVYSWMTYSINSQSLRPSRPRSRTEVDSTCPASIASCASSGDKHSSISSRPIMPSYHGGTHDGCF
jgi:hypothetical protein